MNSLRRYQPYNPIDDFFRGFLVRPLDVAKNGDAPEVRVDVQENDKSYLVHAEIPGVKKEDIHVDIDGAVVTISAERKQEKDVKEGERVLRTERYYGKVSRSFQLSQELEEGEAVAKYADGVLALTLPKKAAVQAKRVTIQ